MNLLVSTVFQEYDHRNPFLPSEFFLLYNNSIFHRLGCTTIYNWSPTHGSYDFPDSLPQLFASGLDPNQPKETSNITRCLH